MIDGALRSLGEAEALLVGLDFDGVLAEIVARPEDAIPVDGVAEVLADLVRLSAVRVAAVSGRRRDDLAERLTPPAGVILVGEHGADTGAGALPEPPGYEEVRDILVRVASRHPGAWVEDKRTGMTLHARALDAETADLVAGEAERALAPVVPGRFERGRRVVDVRLTGVTKGEAVAALRRPSELVLYIGDDTTDETVFETLGPDDVGVKVGSGDTAASHRLADPPAVVRLLRDLVRMRLR
ncbi:MAG TPA: trehalose-phosphatase [Acidimicrobiia bacterium]|nr:trehalose-phosphatase [Acidimicrobiia bacterium]